MEYAPVAPYAFTIFLGAFLLFFVQPLIGKYILPWFGGGPGVWTSCLLFFQMLLLGGYGYAHWSARRLRPRTHVILHLVLLAAALCFLPVIPGETWKPRPGGDPVLQIITVLLVTLGLPYLVLASTGPLVQQWFLRVAPGKSPYRLYALSNAGSLLALLAYPFLFEPYLTRRSQAWFWSVGLAAYALACAFCAVRFLKKAGPAPSDESTGPLGAQTGPASAPKPRFTAQLLWVLLPACASLLLLAITNKLCQDVAVIPFLWVLPLALYLLTFIISFDSPRWYARGFWTFALIAGMAGLCWAVLNGDEESMYKQIAVYLAGLFVCCLVCHGELYRLRPNPVYLTRYYLLIAFGGALGGLLVAVAAPVLFHDYYELHWGLLLCALLFVVVCLAETGTAEAREWRWISALAPLLAFGALDRFVVYSSKAAAPPSRPLFLALRIGLWVMLVLAAGSWVLRGKHRGFRYWRPLALLWLSLGTVGLGVALALGTRNPNDESIYHSRNFYGVLTIYEHRRDSPEDHHLLLQHGRITHGLQFVAADQAAVPTTYYGAGSGIELGIQALPERNRRIGVVGLGAGTITAYGRGGDYIRIYEINPEVKRLSSTFFTYLRACPATVEIALGDARLSLEREPPQKFDLLALDAFSSDAIPVHLLTREAFDLYERHMAPDGIIAVHISNHYLDLEPVVANLGHHFGLNMALIDLEENEEEWWLYGTTWILLSRNKELLQAPAIHNASSRMQTNYTRIPLWTDDFTSLFRILK